MGFFSKEHRASDQQPKPLPANRAARVARRGGNAIVATTSAPRPTRTERVRGGGRGA